MRKHPPSLSTHGQTHKPVDSTGRQNRDSAHTFNALKKLPATGFAVSKFPSQHSPAIFRLPSFA
jgi:hypothetical protein